MKVKEEYTQHQELHNQGFVFDPEEKFFYTDVEVFEKPEQYEFWSVQKYDPMAYYQDRIKQLGCTDEDNMIELIDDRGKFKSNILQANKYGDIEIVQYGLNRKIHEKRKDPKRLTPCAQVRLHPLRAAVCQGKYDFSEAINVPFWPKLLVEAYEKQTVVETVYITEGQIKAFKAAKEGMPTIGLTSISHFRDSKTKSLHPEILDFIKTCSVKNIIILWDNDCVNISEKSVNARTPQELTKRPNLFYTFAVKIKELIYEYSTPKQVQVFFAAINDNDKNSKGIDDLLIDFSPKLISSDANQLAGRPSQFFTSINISTDAGVKKMRSFFNLDGVTRFYQFHKGLIKERKFYYFNNLYSIDKGNPHIEASAEVRDYKYIGTELYRLVDVPVSSGKNNQLATEKRLVPWKWETFALQVGKDKKHLVESFKGFCNIPSHTDYQQVVHEHWNLYYDLDWKLEQGDWPTIHNLLEHLFQRHYDMALDYISILYKHPTEKLPINVLASKLQETGKSTFIFLMKQIFKQNMAIISNNDLTSDFNSHWTSKLIVACEETLLEKKDGKEKLKSISTAHKITRNEKNKAQTDIDCHVKFILSTNHIDDFIRLEDNDRRFWIHAVKALTKKDHTAQQRMVDEIPAFLNYLNEREIYHPQKTQLWFETDLIKTDAFHNIVQNSIPTVIKEVKEVVVNMMLVHGVEEVKLAANDFKKYFNIRGEINYINKSIAEHLPHIRANSTTYSYYIEGSGDGARVYAKGRPFVFRAEELLTQQELEACRSVRIGDHLEGTNEDKLDELMNK